MQLSGPCIATIIMTGFGALISAPALFNGFKRRGKGVKYERNFLIQRAPQLFSLINIALIASAFIASNRVFPAFDRFALFTSQENLLPASMAAVVSWIGVLVLVSGLIFMIGGWYSLGECFSTDAELLEGQTIRSNGLLRFVMHPAYSGIIQSLVGASLACLSAASLLFALAVVAPLWLKRARYEEELLMDTFGERYREYARQLKWRRIIPVFIPIGV